MTREVDLASYLPEFMKEYKEPVAALKAQDPEFDIVWDAVNRILYNRFISTADEYGIGRYEKLLGIYPKSTDTLENRRMVVQNRWFNTIPYTMKVLTTRLIELFGSDHNFSIRSDFQTTYELEVTVYTLDNSRLEELKYILEYMTPMNIVTNIVFERGFVGDVYCGAVMNEADIIEIKQR